MHILSPVTDNCPTWISGRQRNDFMTSLHERMLQDRRIAPATSWIIPVGRASDRATRPGCIISCIACFYNISGICSICTSNLILLMLLLIILFLYECPHWDKETYDDSWTNDNNARAHIKLAWYRGKQEKQFLFGGITTVLPPLPVGAISFMRLKNRSVFFGLSLYLIAIELLTIYFSG